ncbi:MAG TPA: 23S rRNA (uracil(1939)-C(5))-methyltransferase RlmD [Candidatus Rifleibacterium sp.]|nr:23S rRNA (uracil(1939)-C(5))-methyltransferase RlmD [Candidatus Rifleibacterium sp.]HPT48125.1 23S rRNA (uracil(1939)-C(5))-methyltransferase RlmD [Candidatus Rifleibacterium sp.]
MENVLLERMTYGIDALGHIDGKVVFVPYGAPGDRVNVKITEEKTDYLRGEIEEIVEKSAERRNSPCPNFPECGGCHWLHILPEAQRREKEETLRFILKPLYPEHIYPMEPLPMTGYRNKMELKVAVNGDQVVLGNYRYHSHDVVSMQGCIVQCRPNLEVYDSLAAHMNKPEQRPLAENINTIVLRTLAPQQHCAFLLKNAPTQEMLNSMQAFFDQTESLSRLEAHSDNGNHLTLVREKGVFAFMGRNWRVSPNSFFQNNLEGSEAILHTLLSIYQGGQHKGKLIDLYCGCGTQTFLLENLFEEVHGVECNVSSYQDALAYQKTRNSSKSRFLCRKAETIFNTPITKGVIAALHMNPPRTGISQRVLRGLSGIKPRLITYLSCNPMTFRRDAKAIKQLGYRLESVYSFDLFPGTFHMETLSVFIRS